MALQMYMYNTKIEVLPQYGQFGMPSIMESPK